eukprot:SAG31_NODE_1024_length_10294_cov_7.215400_5_plen_216_part_00
MDGSESTGSHPAVFRLPDLSAAQRADLLSGLSGRIVHEVDLEEAIGLASPSPLWLKLLAERLAADDSTPVAAVVRSAVQTVNHSSVGFDELSAMQIGGFPKTVAKAFDEVLNALDVLNGPLVAIVLQAVFCTCGGLAALQLMQLGVEAGLLTMASSDSPHAIEGWCQLLGAGLQTVLTGLDAEDVATKKCSFVHMQARDAVQRRYLSTSGANHLS